MSDSILRDLALYSLQLAVVLGVGALLPGLLRIRSPHLAVRVYLNLTINFRLGDQKKEKEAPAEQER